METEEKTTTNKKQNKENIGLNAIKVLLGIISIFFFVQELYVIGFSVLVFDFLLIKVLEETIYSEHELTRYYTRIGLIKTFIWISFIAGVIIVGILFSKSLFQGFIGLIVLLMLVVLINKN